MPKPCLAVSSEVAETPSEGRPVVALESTIISHGLPRPENLRVARAIEDTVRQHGAIPATIAVLDGMVRVGLSDAQLEAIGTRDDVVKVSLRDLATAVSLSIPGATTVAATSHAAALAGIRVFATGGLGGVHREARDTWDESADLASLAEEPVVVVCAGVKSILDVPATLERLESLNVTVLGYQTLEFPGFYLTSSGCALDWSVDSAEQVADIARTRFALGIPGSVIVANPLPIDAQLDPDMHDRVLEEGLQAARQRGVSGKAVTPFLLDYFHRATGGVSLDVNTTIILRNAALAADVAVALAS